MLDKIIGGDSVAKNESHSIPALLQTYHYNFLLKISKTSITLIMDVFDIPIKVNFETIFF